MPKYRTSFGSVCSRYSGLIMPRHRKFVLKWLWTRLQALVNWSAPSVESGAWMEWVMYKHDISAVRLGLLKDKLISIQESIWFSSVTLDPYPCFAGTAHVQIQPTLQSFLIDFLQWVNGVLIKGIAERRSAKYDVGSNPDIADLDSCLIFEPLRGLCGGGQLLGQIHMLQIVFSSTQILQKWEMSLNIKGQIAIWLRAG